MTGTSSYQLSYDEQQAAKQRVMAALRVQRLKEVRAQDKQLAKQRNRAFEGLCLDSAAQLQQQLITLITQQRERELACLKAQYEAALASLASAQRQAVDTEQQLAAQAQQKQQLYLQRQAEAQQRFNAALAQVHGARQAELQAVLDRLQRRQQIMVQERDKAHGFADQAKQSAAHQALQRAELSLQEEQRRRQNKVSQIDFKYSRLHELGVPHLVVNNRALPQQSMDAATHARIEAARLQETQQAQAAQQQENARKAADRGVSAQRLLQAEHNRRRMEQALQELEGNAVQQRQQDLAANRLTAAPLLRKWHKQKLQAQARRAFESDFLPGPAATQKGLPSFVAVEAAEQEQQQQHRPRSPAHKAAATADRALKLVQELERQRRVEAAAAAAEREQEQQQRAAARRSAAAAAEYAFTASTVSSEESEVAVDDLISFIPPVSTADDSQQTPQASALASRTTAGTKSSELVRSSMGITELLEEAQELSTDSLLPQAMQSSAGLDSMELAAALVAADVATAAVSAAEAAWPSPQQQASDSAAAAVTESAIMSEGSAAPATAASGSPSGEASTAAAAVISSRDSLDAIIAAADEVLRQLPADMQAAAAARAAAAGQPIPQRAAAADTLEQQQQQLQQLQLAAERPASSDGQGVTSSVEPLDAARSSLTAGSSADAAAILAELRALQQQLGVQVLTSQSSDGALAQLQQFDADIEHLAGQQLPAAMAVEHSNTLQAAGLSQAQPYAAGAALGNAQGDQGASAVAASASAELSAALESARRQLQAAAVPLPVQQAEQQVPVRTQLDELIDRILSPDYPANSPPAPLAGPVPSTHSPTRPPGRSGRLAVAQDHSSSRLRPAAGGRSVVQRDTAAASRAAGGQLLSDDADLVNKLKALGLELQALGVSGAAEIASLSTSSSSIGSVGNNTSSSSNGPLVMPGAAAAGATLRGSLAGSTGSTSLSLPTTVMRAAAAGHQQQVQTLQRPLQVPPLPLVPDSARVGLAGSSTADRQRASAASVSSSAPSLSALLQRAQDSLAAAAAAGHPAAAAAAAGVGGVGVLSSMSAMSDSDWSLSASQEASLLTLQQLLQADSSAAEPSSSETSDGSAPAAAAVDEGQAGAAAELQHTAPATVADLAPSSVVSLPSTLFRQTAGLVAGAQQASQAGSTATAPAASQAPAARPQEGEPAMLPQDTASLLRELLSLSGSSSSPEATPRPRNQAGPTAAAAAAGGALPAGRASVAALQGLSPGSISSAVSSMSDTQLELLLQKAMAAVPTAPIAAVPTAPIAATSAAGCAERSTSGGGAAGSSHGTQTAASAEGGAASLEAALEAVLAAAGPSSAASDAEGRLPFDQTSASTTLPSTVFRTMRPPARQPLQQHVAATTGAVPRAAAALGSSAASALQRAKRSSRARVAEAVGSSEGSSGGSIISAANSAGSAGSGSMGDSEMSSGDTGSSSSMSLSQAATAAPPAAPQAQHTTILSGGDTWGGDVPRAPAGSWGADSLDADFEGGDGASSSFLSMPSTVHGIMAPSSQLQASASVTPPAAAAAMATDSGFGVLDQQQQQQITLPHRGNDGLPLTPILEEDEMSTSTASEMLSASTQEIDALLARLAREHGGRQGRPLAPTPLPAADSCSTVSGTNSSGGDSGGHGDDGQVAADISAAGSAGGVSSGTEGMSAAAAGSSSSSGPDVLMSSDSFSEVVSSLMLHIDSTIASLAAGSSGGAGAAAPSLAQAATNGAVSGPPQQSGPVNAHLTQDEPGGFSFVPVTSSVGGAATAATGQYTARPAAPGSYRAPAAAAAAAGSDISGSAAASSAGLISSSLHLSGINSDSFETTPTDSSTQRYVQQVLLGAMMSSPSATTGATSGSSPNQDAVTSRQQAPPSSSTAAPPATAAVPRRPPPSAAAGTVQAGSSRQGPELAPRQGVAFVTPRQVPAQQAARMPLGGLLSPESTAASSLRSSSDIGQLLADISSGSMVIGPSSSSDDDEGSTVRRATAAGAAAAAVVLLTTQQPAAATAQPLRQRPAQLHEQQPAAGPSTAAALQQAEPQVPLGGGGSSTITSALRAAAETRIGPAGPSYGGLLSPEGSSASEGISRQYQHPAGVTAGAGDADDEGASSSSWGPNFAVRSSSSSRAAAGGGAVGARAALQEPLPRAAAAVPAPSQQQQLTAQPQPHAGQHQGAPAGAQGLAALLADIVSSDPVLAQQLSQQNLNQQHQ